jgi:hypothetical protein
LRSESNYCRTATSGNTRSTRCAAVSAMRRPPQEGRGPGPYTRRRRRGRCRCRRSARARSRGRECRTLGSYV